MYFVSRPKKDGLMLLSGLVTFEVEFDDFETAFLYFGPSAQVIRLFFLRPEAN